MPSKLLGGGKTKTTQTSTPNVIRQGINPQSLSFNTGNSSLNAGFSTTPTQNFFNPFVSSPQSSPSPTLFGAIAPGSGGQSFNRTSLFNPSGGRGLDVDLNLDPEIESLRNESLRGTRDLQGSASDIFQSLLGNNGRFIEARVNPILESNALRRGALERGLSRRGIFGTLANNEIQNFDTTADRNVADQRALATQDGLNAEANVLGVQRALNSDINTIAGQTLSQELATLGLESEIANILINANTPITSGGTSTETTKGGGDPLGSIGGLLGGLGAIGQAGGFAALSDVRLKENVRKIGERNGYNLYEFNYIGQEPRYKGVLAQEVEKINPEAVSEVNGFKAVNYDAIGIEMEVING